MGGIITAGALAFAALMAPEPPRAMLRFPAHVNEVLSANQLRVSVEFSLLIEVIEPPSSHREAINRYAGKPAILEVPLWDDFGKSVGANGIRARVRQP